MNVLSHRGYWKLPDERNQAVAFRRSFDLGFGTETDIRDRAGKLVISHDMPCGDEIELASFLEIVGDRKVPLALNIKADGLSHALVEAMRQGSGLDWFVFDMAVPDMRAYLSTAVAVFSRMSEVERKPAWLESCAGVWLDAFDSNWYQQDVVEDLLRAGKRVCIVSPELHRRDASSTWAMLKPLSAHPGLMICTDTPEEAATFFGGSS